MNNNFNMGKSASELRPDLVRLDNTGGPGDFEIQYEHEFKYPKYG